MPGTFILKPIEANLTHNTDLIGKMNPYCSVISGTTRIKGAICQKGGKHPHWNDSITVPATKESKVLIELMDKDRITHDDNIGSFVLDLKEVQSAGHLSKWFPITYKNKTAGEILLEASFQPEDNSSSGQQNVGVQYGEIDRQSQNYGQEKVLSTQSEATTKEVVTTTATTTTTHPATTAIVEKEAAFVDVSKHSNVWTEQRQVIEPHTFMREVEVTETRSAMQNVEVMEPHKVLKNVQYTRAVPVMTHIEVSEPQVVMKEVEVMEPRLVTKTFQVIENVPVMKQVEVIEMRNAIQEVDTFEPHTFHKQVEVTEYVPVRRQVEVTEPFTMKRAVEYVENVITTQTITKELCEPVTINQEFTTSVGPASVIGVSREYGYVEGFGEMTLSEQQRLSRLQRWTGSEAIFNGLSETEIFFEQQRLSKLSEQEWSNERQRLLALSPQERVLEQRRLIGHYQKMGGFSTKTTETTEKTTTIHGGSGADLQQKSKYGNSNVYHPSPNF